MFHLKRNGEMEQGTKDVWWQSVHRFLGRSALLYFSRNLSLIPFTVKLKREIVKKANLRKKTSSGCLGGSRFFEQWSCRALFLQFIPKFVSFLFVCFALRSDRHGFCFSSQLNSPFQSLSELMATPGPAPPLQRDASVLEEQFSTWN